VLNFAEYSEKWQDDMLWQFREHTQIDGLIKVFAEQYYELYIVFEQLETLRWLNSAAGRQLDNIGGIVVLSRFQAQKLEEIRRNRPVAAIGDETYRLWLRYKLFVNTFDGTYQSFMRTIKMFWTDFPLLYSEELKHPATIFLDTPELQGNFNLFELFSIPFIKPGGVQLILRAHTKTETDDKMLAVGGVSNVKITETVLEEAVFEYDLQLAVGGVSNVKITETVLEEYVQEFKAQVKINGTPTGLFSSADFSAAQT